MTSPPSTSTWHQPTPTRRAPATPPPGWVLAPLDEPERRPIRFELAAMMVLAVVPGFLLGLEGIADPQQVSLDLTWLELTAMVAAASGPAAMATYLLWRDRRLGVAGFGPHGIGPTVAYGVLGALACLLGVVLVLSALMTVGLLDPDAEAEADALGLSASTLVIAYVLSITAGVTEEIIFRGYAITRLREIGWGRAAWIVPGAVFTALHLYQGVLALAVIGVVTAILTWLYWTRASIWPAVVAHALYDAAILTLVLAGPGGG